MMYPLRNIPTAKLYDHRRKDISQTSFPFHGHHSLQPEVSGVDDGKDLTILSKQALLSQTKHGKEQLGLRGI